MITAVQAPGQHPGALQPITAPGSPAPAPLHCTAVAHFPRCGQVTWSPGHNNIGPMVIGTILSLSINCVIASSHSTFETNCVIFFGKKRCDRKGYITTSASLTPAVGSLNWPLTRQCDDSCCVSRFSFSPPPSLQLNKLQRNRARSHTTRCDQLYNISPDSALHILHAIHSLPYSSMKVGTECRKCINTGGGGRGLSSGLPNVKMIAHCSRDVLPMLLLSKHGNPSLTSPRLARHRGVMCILLCV